MNLQLFGYLFNYFPPLIDQAQIWGKQGYTYCKKLGIEKSLEICVEQVS